MGRVIACSPVVARLLTNRNGVRLARSTSKTAPRCIFETSGFWETHRGGSLSLDDVSQVNHEAWMSLAAHRGMGAGLASMV